MLFWMGVVATVVAVIWLIFFFLPSACSYSTIARKRDQSYLALRHNPDQKVLLEEFEQNEQRLHQTQQRNTVHLLVFVLIGVLALFFFLLNAVINPSALFP